MTVSAWCCSPWPWRSQRVRHRWAWETAPPCSFAKSWAVSRWALVVGFINHLFLLRTKSYTNQLLLLRWRRSAWVYSVALHVDVSGPISHGRCRDLRRECHRTATFSLKLSHRSGRSGMASTTCLNSLLFVMIGFVIVLVHNLDWAPPGYQHSRGHRCMSAGPGRECLSAGCPAGRHTGTRRQPQSPDLAADLGWLARRPRRWPWPCRLPQSPRKTVDPST